MSEKERSEYNTAYWHKNKERLNENSKRRVAQNLEIYQQRRKVYYQKHKQERIAYSKNYAKNNRELVLEKYRAYHVANRDRVLEKQRERRRRIREAKPPKEILIKDPLAEARKKQQRLEKRRKLKREHREHFNRQLREWREKNRDRIREQDREYYRKNRDEVLRRIAENRKNKPAKFKKRDKAIKIRRIIREVGAKGKHTHKQWMDRVEYYSWRCYYCGTKLDEKTLTKDHAIPIAKNGTNFSSNLVPACGSCNSSKGVNTATEYASKKGIKIGIHHCQ